MKRKKAVGMLCAALLLSGCQPTTDAAIVTPKSAIAGAKMVDEEAVGDVPEQVQAPETCESEIVTEDDMVKIYINAKVSVPEVDGIRLKKVETRVFGQEDMDNLQENLLRGNPLERRVYTEEQRGEGIRCTRDEIWRIIEAEKEYYGELQARAEEYGQDLEDEMDWWYGELDRAPESFPVKEVSTKVLYDKYAAERFLEEQSEEGNANFIWGSTQLDGEIYNFFLNNNWTSEFKNVLACLVRSSCYQEYGEWNLYTSEHDYYTDGFTGNESYDMAMDEAGTLSDGWEKADDSETEAYDRGETWLKILAAEEEWPLETPLDELKAKGDALTEALGRTDLELAAQKECSIFDNYAGISMTAVNLIYTPVLDGVPVTYTDYRYTYNNENMGYEESFEAAYDDGGLAQVKWQNPAKIYDMSDEYVFLLPFSDILEIFRNEAPELQRTYGTEETVWKYINITDIKLGYMWVPDESTEMEGMLIPVWDFLGSYVSYSSGNEWQGVEPSWHANTSPYQSFLTVNAMDGSVMEGYVRLY